MNDYQLNVKDMGNKIKLARAKAGLTQQQLADKAETTKTTIVDIEKVKTKRWKHCINSRGSKGIKSFS